MASVSSKCYLIACLSTMTCDCFVWLGQLLATGWLDYMITLISVYTLCSFPRRLDEWWTNNKSLADKLPLPRHAYFTHFYLFIRGFAILYSISSGVKDRRMWGDWAIRGSGVRGNPTNELPYLLVENCGKIRKWILCTEKAHMLSWRYSQDTVSKQSPVQYTKVSISQKMRQKLQQFFHVLC